MTMLDLLRIFFELSLIFAGCFVIYKEKALIKFEKKAARYIKGFFKACAYTLRDSFIGKKETVKAEVKTIGNPEFEEILVGLNKSAEIIDIKDAMIAWLQKYSGI